MKRARMRAPDDSRAAVSYAGPELHPSSSSTPAPMKIVPLLCAGTLCCLYYDCSASAQAPSDWAQFLGPNRTGKVDGLSSPFAWGEKGPDVLWRTPTGPGFGGAAVQGSASFGHELVEDTFAQLVMCKAPASILSIENCRVVADRDDVVELHVRQLVDMLAALRRDIDAGLGHDGYSVGVHAVRSDAGRVGFDCVRLQVTGPTLGHLAAAGVARGEKEDLQHLQFAC